MGDDQIWNCHILVWRPFLCTGIMDSYQTASNLTTAVWYRCHRTAINLVIKSVTIDQKSCNSAVPSFVTLFLTFFFVLYEYRADFFQASFVLPSRAIAGSCPITFPVQTTQIILKAFLSPSRGSRATPTSGSWIRMKLTVGMNNCFYLKIADTVTIQIQNIRLL